MVIQERNSLENILSRYHPSRVSTGTYTWVPDIILVCLVGLARWWPIPRLYTCNVVATIDYPHTIRVAISLSVLQDNRQITNSDSSKTDLLENNQVVRIAGFIDM
jgi:hypothetical protein